MKNKKIGIAVVCIVIVIALVLMMRPKASAPTMPEQVTEETPAQTATVAKPVSKQAALAMSGDVANLVSLSIAPNVKIVPGARVYGSLSGGYFYEGQAIVKLLDAKKKVLKTFPMISTSPWQTSGPVSFSFTFDAAGLPQGQGYIRLQNDNPSGDQAKVKYIDIPTIY